MPEPVPALIVSRLRRIAANAERRKVKLDPETILLVLNGKDAK